MNEQHPQTDTGSGPQTGYEPPTIQVISLACEISAYAPDEDDSPLF